MKKLLKLLMMVSFITTLNLHAELTLPANRPNKEVTVPLELIVKDIQDYINANKPVAASSRMNDAQEELRRIKVRLSPEIEKLFVDTIDQMQFTIKLQKEYQIKKHGKLLEVN